MRKRIIRHGREEAASSEQDWLNVEGVAEVEITSEDAAHPIESALLPDHTSGGGPRRPGHRRSGFSFTIRNDCDGSG